MKVTNPSKLFLQNGGPSEARKRVLAQLPISAQSYSPSPLLDLSLFSYDEKWVSVMERPKACGEHPIRCETTVQLMMIACLSLISTEFQLGFWIV